MMMIMTKLPTTIHFLPLIMTVMIVVIVVEVVEVVVEVVLVAPRRLEEEADADRKY